MPYMICSGPVPLDCVSRKRSVSQLMNAAASSVNPSRSSA